MHAPFPRPLIARFMNTSGEQGRAADSPLVDLEEYLDILVRNIEELCNTRAAFPLAPTPEIAGRPLTVREWGVPDWTGFSPHSPETCEQLCRAIERSLAAFEPRLRGVAVRPLEETDATEFGTVFDPTRGLRLRVDARLAARDSVRLVLCLHLHEEGISASELRYGF